MMTSKVVTTLERQGLLRHAPDAVNGRLKRVSQTPRGRELTVAALEALRRTEEQFFGGMDAVALRHELAAVCDRAVDASADPGTP